MKALRFYVYVVCLVAALMFGAFQFKVVPDVMAIKYCWAALILLSPAIVCVLWLWFVRYYRKCPRCRRRHGLQWAGGYHWYANGRGGGLAGY